MKRLTAHKERPLAFVEFGQSVLKTVKHSTTTAAISVALATGALSVTGKAHAGGFALIEIGASGLGNAYAGASAVSADTSTVWFNPAGMLHLAPREFAAAAHVISTDSTFNNRGTSLSSLVGGAPVSGPATEDIGQETGIPNLFYVHRLSGDLALGFGLTVPFGSATEYDDDWVGRYSASESGVAVFDFNPTIAYRLNEKVILGGGLSLQYMEATLSSVIDSGTSCLGLAGAPNSPLRQVDCINAGLAPGNQATDSFSEVQGDSVDFTFNVSALIEPQEGTRFGIAYRHGVDHSIEGDVDFQLNPALAQVVESAGLPLFVDGGAQAGADLPPTVMMSVAHQASDRLQLLADATWTGWSSLEELRVTFDNPAQPDAPTPLNWKNVWRLSVGGNYQLNDTWTLRGGLAFDEEAIRNSNFRSPRIPGNDRYWISFGAGYQLSDSISFDFGFSHLMLNDTAINNNILDAAGGSTVRGFYQQSVNIAAAQFNWKF